MTSPSTTSIGRPERLGAAPRTSAVPRRRDRTWTRGVTAATIAAFLIVATALALRWPLSGTVVPWDSKNHFYAMARFLGDALRHGTVPLWNPYQFSGYPAVADPQSLIFTPTLALFASVAPNASMQAFDLAVYAHLVGGALAMIGLARRWGWQPLPALLAALVYAFGAAAAGRLQHVGMIVSYAFFPPTLWALQAAMERRSLAGAALAGGLAALMAFGRDQVAFLLCLVLVGFVARELLREGDPLRALRRHLPVLLVAGATVLALTAAPILLTMQLLHGSNRPGISYGVALQGSLDPANLLTLLAPNLFGSLDSPYDYWGPGTTTIFGDNYTDRSTNYLFAGTVPLVLLLWHGIAGRRMGERGVRALAAMGMVALLFALGRFTPVFGLAFDLVPGVSLYRRPADATFVVTIALAFASGYLLQRFLESGSPRPAWPGLVAVAIGVAAVAGAGLALSVHAAHLRPALLSLGEAALVVAAIVLALLWSARTPRRRPLVAALLVGATAAQLGWRNAASALNAEPARNYSAFLPDPSQQAALAALHADLDPRVARGERPRVEFLGLDGSWQNAAMVLKLEATTGYNPLRIAAYSRAVGVGENSNEPRWRTFPDTFRGYNSHLAALLGLDYLVLDRPIAALPRQVPRPHATLLYAGDHIDVYRLENPVVPRATLASRWRVVNDEAIVEAGALPDFSSGDEALIDAADVGHLPAASAAVAGTGTATITAADDNGVTVTVDAPGPSVLVLHDLYYPGWQARVDGAETPILHADLLFRGVAVPAGHHTVQFGFHPFSLANLGAAARGLLHGTGG